MNEEITTIDMLRHGEAGDGIPRFRGRTDDTLTANGWSRLRALVPDKPPWDLVVSSPLLRCADFARELAHDHDLPYRLEPRLAEMDFGDWDGVAVRDVQANDPQALGRFWKDPLDASPPNGESLGDFCTRVLRAWQQLHTDGLGRHVLVISHGGVMRVILAQVLGMQTNHLWRLQISTAKLSRICYYDSYPVLEFLNRDDLPAPS